MAARVWDPGPAGHAAVSRCGHFPSGIPSCRSVLGAGRGWGAGCVLVTCTCGGSREDTGLGERWCQLRWLPRGAAAVPWGARERGETVRVTCIRPQAASGGSEPGGVAALRPRPTLKEGRWGPCAAHSWPGGEAFPEGALVAASPTSPGHPPAACCASLPLSASLSTSPTTSRSDNPKRGFVLFVFLKANV